MSETVSINPSIEETVRELQERVAALEQSRDRRKTSRKTGGAMRTVATNESLLEMKSDIEIVLSVIRSVLDGTTITAACSQYGISYPKFQRFLNFARLPYDEKQKKTTIRLDEKRFSTWEERLYADLFCVRLGSSELAGLMPDDAKDTIREALKTLTERERTAIESVYEYDETLEQAGEMLGVTRERARQIALSGIRKIRHRYGNEMQCGVAAVKRAEQIFTEQKEAKIAELVERRKAMDVEYRMAEHELTTPADGRAHSVKIADMGLSTRAYNVLARYEKRTLADLLSITNAQTLRSMRNCGSSVYNEILGAVHRLGYAMQWE